MILNSPYISGSLTVTGNTNLIGALTVTGSLAGTATSSSFAYTASSAVSAYTAASAVNATTALTASYATSFTVGGTLTAQTLVVQTITSSVSFITGSTRFGSLLTNTHQFTGSMFVTGSSTFSNTVTALNAIINNGINSTDGIKIVGALSSSAFTSGLEFIRTTVTGGSKIQPLRDIAIGGVGFNFLVTANNTAEVNATYTSALQILNTGAVGIGTASPAYQLQVLNTIGLRANSVDFQAIKGTGFGYSPGSYKVVLLGSSASADFTTVSIGYDPSGNSNSSFNGSGVEVLFRRGVQFVTPNSANNAYYLSNLVLYDGNVGVGTITPGSKLHLYDGSNPLSLKIQRTTVPVYLSDVQTAGTTAGSAWSHNVENTSNGSVSWGSFANVAYAGSAIMLNANTSNSFITLHTAASVNTNPSERVRITGGGIVCVAGTSQLGSSTLSIFGSIAARNSGVDATFAEAFTAYYSANDTESNAISTAVSSAAGQSGFRFDVSNGAGSAARTASMYIYRTSVSIVGSLSKGSGTFKIDHPLESKKDTHHLVHSFIEGPRVDLIYRGKATLVDGAATINIDESAGMTEGTFAALNRDVQCFTTNESGWDLVKGKVEGNILTIISNNSNSTDEISWMVIGERQDKHIKDTDWTDENGKPILEPLKTI